MNETHSAPPQGGDPQHPGQLTAHGAAGPYGGQPDLSQPPAQPPTPRRRSWFARHKMLTGIGVVVAIIAIGSASGGGDGDAPSGTPSDAPAAATADPKDVPSSKDSKGEEPTEEKATASVAKNPGIGDKVRDGKFEFTVVETSDGGTSIGPKGFATKAQGRFLLVRVDVTNIGDEPQYFFGDNQSLFDAEGRKFAADTTAAIYLEDSSSFIEEINPGNTVEGTVVFDLPKGVDPVRIELHDSAFSGGVTVDLD